MHSSNSRQLLLEDLFKLSANHADYGGTVELENEKYRLRYFPNPEPWLVEEHRETWNRGVRELEQIAPRVIDYLRRKGVDAIEAETKGASVMAWVLRPWLIGNRSSASAVSSAFSAIRESIIMLDANPIELTNELYVRLYNLVHRFHRQGHVRFYVTQGLDDGLTEKHVDSYRNLYRSEFKFLNEHLSVVTGYPSGLRNHPALADYVTRTMARARSDLLPTGFDTFADEAIARFEKCKGLYLRLAESIALPLPIDRKYGDDYKLWREFNYDDDFSKLLSGLKWERATILEMLPVSSEKMQTQDDPVLQFLNQLYELRHKAGLLRRDFIDLNEVQLEREKLSQIASEILEPAYKRWAAVAIGRFGADPDSWAIVADELHKELQDNLSKLPSSVTLAPQSTLNTSSNNPIVKQVERDPKESTTSDLPKVERLAYLAAKYAEAKLGRELKDREAWDYLHENGIEGADELNDYGLPMLNTFSDYLTRARRKLGESRYEKRGGRVGGSIVKQSDL